MTVSKKQTNPKLTLNIDKQLESSSLKNIFFNTDESSLRFIPETLQAIQEIGTIDSESESILIDYVTNKVLLEFCRINQYYHFDNNAKNSLKDIYNQLFKTLKNKDYDFDSISEAHFQNLKNWLLHSNPYAQQLYENKDAKLVPVACSEYTPGLQIEILQLETENILEPVLDIGCGPTGDLVKLLRSLGKDVVGIDRFASQDSFLINSDWFEFNFGIQKWGTIISNLGFSNHFRHHHFREEGSFVDYAKQYICILNSLKIGGKFHYAPDLPFIEDYLDRNKYLLTKKEVGKYGFKSTTITRIR